MPIIDLAVTNLGNPVDAIEQFAEHNDWIFDRSGDDEITISMAGNYADYHVSFTWLEEMQSFFISRHPPPAKS